MPNTFAAKYPGICATCGDRFRESDLIGYDADDEISCNDCLTGQSAQPRRAQPTDPCPDCNLEHAGECF